ncbi:conserved Plasmodium protein, unknown function [Plasmodium yoelii]|uniref:Ookinete surface and oocyst capsule protein OSCP n=3 Tax=Plasmodium yoelii TaxID=5861 RepID=A0AAE9WSX3_PLAYO|nr:conserved Plasmodium protein, unknown function [Plasmodium yoelii]WBY58040.1 ookinete surface and oocyst capsule protein OSCP [Plasmodium yoelii yoelii]CDU85105.1 conserved Plasmodium protein, unknown function [Plasmodium yoelii]VTZ79000.1 conserved Plasmodium protein, unknown function [Plasmodium yoelii]|eukprot:XP_022813350.1 conserved Plasmodium protein, unknown function [Plasmodium yoelii]
MSTVEDKMDINQNNVDLCKYYKNNSTNNSDALKYDNYFFRDFKKTFLNCYIKKDNYCKIILSDESNLQYVKWMINLMNYNKYKKEILLQVLLDIQKICNIISLFFIKIYIHIYIYLYALRRLYLSAFCFILKYLIKKYKCTILNKIGDINKIIKLSNIKKVKGIDKNVSNIILTHEIKCSPYYDWYKIETNDKFEQNGKTHYYSSLIYPKLYTGILLVPTNNHYFVLNKNVDIKNSSKKLLILLMNNMVNYCQIDYIENVYVCNQINNKKYFNKCEKSNNNKKNSTIIVCISKTNRNFIIVAYNINKKNYPCVKNICGFIEKQRRCYNTPSYYKNMRDKIYINDNNNNNISFSHIKYYLKLDTKIKKEKKIKNSLFDFRENENQSSYIIYKIPNNLCKKREISKMYNIKCNILYVYYFFGTRQKNIVSEILYYSSCKNLTKGIYYEDFHLLFFLIKKLYIFRKPLLVICLNNFEVINFFISDSINVIYCYKIFIKKYILSKKYNIISKRDVMITYYYIQFNLSKERNIYHTKINHILLNMLNGWICKKYVIKFCIEDCMKICAERYIIITFLKLYAKYFRTFINRNFDFSGLLNCNINFINISNDNNINGIVNNNSDNNNSINFHRSTNYSISILRKKRGKNRHLHNLQKYVYFIIFYNIVLHVKNKPIKKINILFSEKDSLYVIKKLSNYVKKKKIFILYYIYNNIDIFFIRVNFKSNIRRNIFFKIIIKYIKNVEKLKRYGEICFFSKIINREFIQQKKAINTFFSISKKFYKFKYYNNLTKKKKKYIYFFFIIKCNEELYSKYKSMNIIRNEFKEEKYIENSEKIFNNIFMKTCVKQCNNKENNDDSGKKTGTDKRNTKDGNDSETGSNGNNENSGNDGDGGNNSGKDKNSSGNGDNNDDKQNDDKDKKNNRNNKEQDKERKKKNDMKKGTQKNSADNTDKDGTNKTNDSNDNKNNENDEDKEEKENKENKEENENKENKEENENKENKEKTEINGNVENTCKKRKCGKGLTRNRNKGKNLNENSTNIMFHKTDEACSINVDSPILNVEKKDPVKRRKENKIDRKNYNHEKNEKYSLNMLIAENAHKIIKNGRVYKQFEPCYNHQTHNNFMLKELLWMSIDFYEEKRWKKNVSKRFSYLMNTNFYEKQKNDKYFISSQISNDIKMFWFFILNEIRPDLVPIDLDHKVKNKNGIKKDFFRIIKKNIESKESNFKNIINNINLNTNNNELNSKQLGMVNKGERENDRDKNENKDKFLNSENEDTTSQKTHSGISNKLLSLNILNEKNMNPDETTSKNDNNSNDLNILPKTDNNIIEEHCQNLGSNDKTVKVFKNDDNEFENGLTSYEECLAKLENNVNKEMLNKYEYNSKICYNDSKNCNKINEISYKNTFYYNEEYSDYYDNNNDRKYNVAYNGICNNFRYYNNHMGNNSYCKDCNYLDLSDQLYIYCLLFISISLIEIKENIFYNIDNISNEDKVTILDEENDTHISKATYSKIYAKDNFANEEQQTTSGDDNVKNGDIDQSNDNDKNNNYMCNGKMEINEENINCDGKDKMTIENKANEIHANEGNDGNNHNAENIKNECKKIEENINQLCEVTEKINENKILKMIKKESKNSTEHYNDKSYKEYKINQNGYHKNYNIYDNTNDEGYKSNKNYPDYYDDLKSNVNYNNNNSSNNMVPFLPALSNIDIKELIVIPYSLPHDNIINKETAYSLESERKMYEWINEIKERNINIYMNNMESYGGKSYPFEFHNIDNYYNNINLPLTKLTEYDEYTFFLYLFYIKNSPYILKKQIQKDKKKRKRDLSDITPPKKRASRRKLNKESGEKEIEIIRESEKVTNNTEDVDSKGISEINLLQTNNNSILIKGEENKNFYNNKLTSKNVGEIKKDEPQFSKDNTEKEIKLWKERKLEWTNDEINFLLILANTYINYINIDTTTQIMDNKGTNITINNNNNQNEVYNAENNNITIKNTLEVSCSTTVVEIVQKENKTLSNENDAKKLNNINKETPNECKSEGLGNLQNIKMNNLNDSILSTEGKLDNTNISTPHFKKNNESDKTIEDMNYVYYINWTIISLALTSYNKINNICEIPKSAEECRDKFLSLTKDNKYKNYNIYNLHENNYINPKNNIDNKKSSRKLKFLSIFSTTRTNTLIEAFNKYMNKKIEKYKLRKMARTEKKMEHGQEVIRSKGEMLNGDKSIDQTNYIIKTNDLRNSIFCDESEQTELLNNTLTEEMTQSNYKQTSISSNSSSKNDSMRSNIQNEISETLKDGSFFNDINLDTNMNRKEDFINNLFKDVSVNNYETSEEDAECGEDSFFSYSDVGYCSSGELYNNKSSIKLENMVNILDNLDNVEKLKIENNELRENTNFKVKEIHDDITEGKNKINDNCEFLDGDEKKIYNNITEGEIENNINDNKPNCFIDVTKKYSGITSNKIDDNYDNMELQTNESENYQTNDSKMVNDVKSEIYKNDNDGCAIKMKCNENGIYSNNAENNSYKTWKYSSNFTGSMNELICYDKIKKLLNTVCKNKKNVNEFISLLKNEYIIKNPYFLKVIQIFINNVKPVIGYYDNMIDSVNGKSDYIYSNKEYLKDLCKNKIDKEFVKFIRKIIEHDKKQKNKYIEKITKTIPYQNNINSNELIINSPSNSYNTVKNLSTKILNYVPYVDDKKKGNIKQMSKRFNSKNLVSQILLADYIVDKLKTFPISDSSTSTYNNKTIDDLISEYHLKAYTEYINDNFNENSYASKLEKSYVDDPSTEINDESSINASLVDIKNKNVSDVMKNNENELEGKFEISKKFSENFGHTSSCDQISKKENSLYNKTTGDKTENTFNILPTFGNNTPNNKFANNNNSNNETIDSINENVTDANLGVNHEKNIEMDAKTSSNMTLGILEYNKNNTNINPDNVLNNNTPNDNNQGLKKLKKLNSEPSVNLYNDKIIDLGNYTKQIKNSSKTQPIRKSTGTTNKITKYKTSTNLCNYSNNKGRKNNNNNSNSDNNVILNYAQNIKWPSLNKFETQTNPINNNNNDYNNFYKEGTPVFEQLPISHEESNNKQHMCNEKINLTRKRQKTSDNKCNNSIKNVPNESLIKYPSNQPYYQVKNIHDSYFNDNNQTPMKLNTRIPSTDISVSPSSAIMYEHIKGSDISDLANRTDLLCNGSQPGNNVPLNIISSNSSSSNGISNNNIGLNSSSHLNNMGGVIVGGMNSSNSNHIINNFAHKGGEEGDKFVPFSYGALQNNKYVSPSQGNNQLYYNKAPIYESPDIASNKIGGNNTMNSYNSRSADISSNYFNSRILHSLSNSNNINNVNLNVDKNGYSANMRDHIGISRRSSTSILYSETNENNENMIFMKSRSPSNYPSPYNPNKGIIHDNDSSKPYYDSQILQQQMQHQTQQSAQQQSQIVSNTDMVNNMGMSTNNVLTNNKEESNNDPSNISEAKNKNVIYHNYALNKYSSNSVKKLSQINNQNGSNIQPGYHNINYDQINNNYIPQNIMKNHNELISSNNDKKKMVYYPTHPIPNFANINNVPLENLDKHHIAFSNDSFNRNINYLNQMNLVKLDPVSEKENMSTGVKIVGEKVQHTQQSIKNNTQHNDIHNSIIENNLGQSNYAVNMINSGSLNSSSNLIIEGTPNNDMNVNVNNHHNLSPIPSNSMQQSQINIDQNNNYMSNGHERDPASRMQFTPKGSVIPVPNQQNININNQGIKYNEINAQNINQPNNLNSYINQVNFIVQVLNKKKGNQKDNIPPNINQQNMGKYNVDQTVVNTLNLKQGNFANPNLSQPHNNNVIQNGNNNNNNNNNMGLPTYHTQANINLQNIKSPMNDNNISNMLNMGMRNNMPKNIIPNIPPNNVFVAKDVIQQKILQQQQQHKMQQELIHKAHNDKENLVNSQMQFSEEQMQHQKLLQKMKQEQLQKPLQQIHPHQIQTHNMNSQQQIPIHPMQQKMQALQIQSLIKAQQIKKQLHPSQLQQQQMQQKLHPQQIHPQQLRSPQIPQQQLTPQQMQQMKMHNIQFQKHEMKKHMEQLQKNIPYNQQKIHQIYNLQQNIISNDEKNDKQNMHRQISMGINPQIQNMHMLQAKNNDELISKENLNNNLNENPIYAVNRTFSNNINKFKNPDNFYPQNAFHPNPSSNKMDVKDIRNIGNKTLIENGIVLNPSQNRADISNNNITSHILPINMASYNSQNMQCKININKNNSNSQENNNC